MSCQEKLCCYSSPLIYHLKIGPCVLRLIVGGEDFLGIREHWLGSSPTWDQPQFTNRLRHGLGWTLRWEALASCCPFWAICIFGGQKSLMLSWWEACQHIWPVTTPGCPGFGYKKSFLNQESPSPTISPLSPRRAKCGDWSRGPKETRLLVTFLWLASNSNS